MTRQIKANKDFYLQKIYFELLSFFINFKGDYEHNKNSVPLKMNSTLLQLSTGLLQEQIRV